MLVEQILELIILLLILTGGAIVAAQHWELQRLRVKVSAYETQIEQLHEDAIKAKSEAVRSAIEAQRAVRLVNDRSSTIMKEKVSSDCQKAIQWGISESQKI